MDIIFDIANLFSVNDIITILKDPNVNLIEILGLIENNGIIELLNDSNILSQMDTIAWKKYFSFNKAGEFYDTNDGFSQYAVEIIECSGHFGIGGESINQFNNCILQVFGNQCPHLNNALIAKEEETFCYDKVIANAQNIDSNTKAGHEKIMKEIEKRMHNKVGPEVRRRHENRQNQ